MKCPIRYAFEFVNEATACMVRLLSVIKIAANNPLWVGLAFTVMIWPLAGCSSAPNFTAVVDSHYLTQIKTAVGNRKNDKRSKTVFRKIML